MSAAAPDLLHLQCHFGQDTLAWARRGARVIGADLSERAVGHARRLAAETGLDGRFVVSDVVELPASLEGDFDVVFTSFGVRNWLPDVHHWAEVVAHSMGEVVTSLATAGLRIDHLHEHDWVGWKMFPFMVEVSEGVWRLPEPDHARLPLLFSLRATKP